MVGEWGRARTHAARSRDQPELSARTQEHAIPLPQAVIGSTQCSIDRVNRPVGLHQVAVEHLVLKQMSA